MSSIVLFCLACTCAYASQKSDNDIYSYLRLTVPAQNPETPGGQPVEDGRFELKSSRNNIIVELDTDGRANDADSYEYFLEGYDGEWSLTDNRLITYTNLNPGSYRLLVRPRRNGRTAAEVYPFLISVRRPFYQTPYAIAACFLLTVLILSGIVRFCSRRFEVRSIEKEKERLEELNRKKLRFFTNVSHEFRTPLTLITGQIETLLSRGDLPSGASSKLHRIRKNANELLGLITELLDFSKREQGYNRLDIREIELIGYLRDIFGAFKEYAAGKRIKFTFRHSEPSLHVYLDPVQFRKAVYNLLSNAFKYTREGGSISLDVSVHGQHVHIRVIDRGIGIPQEALSKVFDRFFQVDYPESGLSPGTGIGLALAKSIVLAHKGEIHVESALNEGSTFTITLNLGMSHFTGREPAPNGVGVAACFGSAPETPPPPPRAEKPPSVNPEAQTGGCGQDNVNGQDVNGGCGQDVGGKDVNGGCGSGGDAPSVLLVEDNGEILQILTEAFSPQYNVHTACDGLSGWEAALKNPPDIVVSDIMMPNMTGKELCYKIKNNVRTSHIPVVLLTAYGSEQQIHEGLLFNADACVIKPFGIGILLEQCNNLLRNRKLLYEKFRDRDFAESGGIKNGGCDSQLLCRAAEIIKSNFSTAGFDMNRLGSELGLGRTKLYASIKEKTGLTPNEFTLNLKLKEAVKYLEIHRELNISEIAVCLGFSSTKYFSKCFKSFYGVTPQQWRSQRRLRINE